VCKRCQRLGLKCVEHVSRQGQGTRRRKKVKAKLPKDEQSAMDGPVKITADLAKKSLCNSSMDLFNGASPIPCTSAAIVSCSPCTVSCNDQFNNNINNNNHDSRNINGSKKNPEAEQNICAGMNVLHIEDKILCGSIKNGLGRDHFGLNHIVRSWVGLAFSRRSFSLLARASFVAAKMKIPMDDIVSNQSIFSAVTDSQPMDYLATDILLPKSQQKTLGYPIDIREVPWEVLESVQIDPNRLQESIRNRVIAIRWQANAATRYWTSPLFARDFATTAEFGQVWEENRDDRETIDLFLPPSEKPKFAQNLFNIFFVNNKPHMPCFVTKDLYTVQKRNKETIEANVIQTVKLIDLDSSIHYVEIQYLDRSFNNIMGHRQQRSNKREHFDDFFDNVDNEPIMGENIAFTDIPMTEEMEEFLKLIGGE